MKNVVSVEQVVYYELVKMEEELKKNIEDILSFKCELKEEISSLKLEISGLREELRSFQDGK